MKTCPPNTPVPLGSVARQRDRSVHPLSGDNMMNQVNTIRPPEIVTALVGLSLLSLLPVAYKKIKAHRA